MKRPIDLTPEEQLWQQVWRVWPDAMQYEQMETPFDGQTRPISLQGVERGRQWLQAKHTRAERLA
jgi:hypothetical protein